jgi:predicted nucleic acid-binding protein
LIAGVAGFKSGVESPANPSAKFLRTWLETGNFVWLVSEEILDEYKAIMQRLGVRRILIGNIINLLREEAEFVAVPTTPEISPDPADDPFCACAESSNAAFIVTLNPKDFPQRKLRAKVIAPGAVLPTTAPRRPQAPGRSS